MEDNDKGRSRLDKVLGFCADTTAHGLGRVAAAKSRLARLFWIIIFLAAFGYSMFEVNKTADDNLELNKAVKDNLMMNVLQHYERDSWKLGHQAEEMINACSFPGNQKNLPCSYKNFSHHFDTVYGNCYTFNGSSTIVTQPGHRQGFKLYLFIDSEEYMGMLADSVGVIITVHSPFIKPNLDEHSLFATPGSAVYISIQRQNVGRLDYPYNGASCNNNTGYTQKMCFRDCIAKEMREKCGCVSVVARQTPLCDSLNQTQADCLDRVNTQGSLHCSCDLPCNQIHFSNTVSNSAWPSIAHVNQLLSSLKKNNSRAAKTVKDLESARKNMVQVNIHFASMTVTDIKQNPAITRQSLLGTVGGQLGLFIGCSLITIVEFLNLLWRLILPRKTVTNRTKDFELTTKL